MGVEAEQSTGTEGGAGAVADPAVTNPGSQSADPPQRPDFLPESYWDAEKGSAKLEDLGKLAADHAARQAELIDDPEKFDWSNVKVAGPDGVDITIDPENPLVKAFTSMGKDRGWTKSDVSAAAELILNAEKSAAEARAKEYEALGPKRAERLTSAVQTIARLAGYTGQAGQDGKVDDTVLREAQAFLGSTIQSKAQFEFLEKVLSAAGLPPAAEAGGTGGKVVDVAKRLYPNEAKYASGAR